MPVSKEEIKNYLEETDSLIAEGKYSDAVNLLNRLIYEAPDISNLHCKLGTVLMQTQLKNDAKTHIDKALVLAPEQSENWELLGRWHKSRQEWFPAIKAFEKAKKLKNAPETTYNIFELYCIVKDTSSALHTISKLVDENPESIIYRAAYARYLSETGEKTKALILYEQLVERREVRQNLDILNEWFTLEKDLGNIDKVYQWLGTHITKEPENALLKLFYSRVCYIKLHYDEAFSVIKEAYELDPENLEINWTMGTLYTTMEHPKKAIPFYLTILKKEPLNIKALGALALIHPYQYGDDAFQSLNVAAAHLAKLTVAQRRDLHYILGKAYEDVKEYDTAFLNYQKGGALRNINGEAEKEYNDVRYFANAVFSTDPVYFSSSTDLAEQCQSELPLFIVGMPRSGTTLLEQVLTGMEGVFGAGELPYIPSVLNGLEFGKNHIQTNSSFFRDANVSLKDRAEKYLEALPGQIPSTAMRVIDKLPQNFLFTGFIHLLFPRAKIIHIQRHPIETCLSAYKINFLDGQHWADDLQIAGRYYRVYTELMAYWRKVLPQESLLEVRYENLVENLEYESRKIAKFIGIEWSEKCLTFHQQKKSVHTASSVQVRKPLYKSPTSKWRVYAEHIQPLLDEIGDLASNYETELKIMKK